MFLDASAIVAMLTEEVEGDALARQLAVSDVRLTSALALFVAGLAIARKGQHTLERASDILARFVGASNIRVEPITEEIGFLALKTFARYGKGTGHPAQLNLGDCLAYAMAKAHGARLLYKGDDFARTDLA